MHPSRGVASGVKGKGKVVASSGVPLPVERPMSHPTLEVLMSYLSLLEEQLLKDLNKEVISALGTIYGHEAFQGCKSF